MGTTSLIEDLEFVSEVAQRAGALVLQRRAAYGITGVRAKAAPLDLVSDLDHAAEDLICTELLTRFPHDAILAEERGKHGKGRRRWVIDPIDGSVNCIHGISPWGNGICLVDDGEMLLSVVHLPITGETFGAARGAGFFVDGEPAFNRSGRRRPDGPELSTAIIETSIDDARWATSARQLGALFRRAGQMRVFAATLPALAFVADARLDGCVGRDMPEWDWSPGALLVQESGGVVAQAGPFVYAAGRACADELAACLRH